MNNKHFFVDFDVHLIQQIRLIQAMAESNYSISISKGQEYKFNNLTKKFSFNLYNESKNDSQFLSEVITVNHTKPSTCIGTICKPLIFPHEICSHCRSLWKDSRNMKFSFIGLATEERKKILDEWINSQTGTNSGNILSSILFKIKENWELRVRNKTSHRKLSQLHFFSSRLGRHYPTKAWDISYYEILSNTNFVLCPSGKFDWTYRFFEAILCGAIPVVERNCEVYNGFKFHYMHEPVDNLSWTEEVVEHNYNLCVERITIPLPVLNDQLQNLLS